MWAIIIYILLLQISCIVHLSKIMKIGWQKTKVISVVVAIAAANSKFHLIAFSEAVWSWDGMLHLVREGILDVYCVSTLLIVSVFVSVWLTKYCDWWNIVASC